MPNSQLLESKLEVDGKKEVIDATFSLRWVDTLNGSSYPVLYKNGKRVVKAWSITMSYNSPPDEFGGNANTD